MPTIMMMMKVGTAVGMLWCHRQGRVLHHGLPSPWDLAPRVCDSTGYIEGYTNINIMVA